MPMALSILVWLESRKFCQMIGIGLKTWETSHGHNTGGRFSRNCIQSFSLLKVTYLSKIYPNVSFNHHYTQISPMHDQARTKWLSFYGESWWQGQSIWVSQSCAHIIYLLLVQSDCKPNCMYCQCTQIVNIPTNCFTLFIKLYGKSVSHRRMYSTVWATWPTVQYHVLAFQNQDKQRSLFQVTLNPVDQVSQLPRVKYKQIFPYYSGGTKF